MRYERRVEIRRTIYWSKATGTVVPVDGDLGLEVHRYRPGVRQMCCRTSLHGSFAVTGENLWRTAPLMLSEGAMRQIVENQGRAVPADQPGGSKHEALIALRDYGAKRIDTTDSPTFGQWATTAAAARPNRLAAFPPPASKARPCAGTPTTPKPSWTCRPLPPQPLANRRARPTPSLLTPPGSKLAHRGQDR